MEANTVAHVCLVTSAHISANPRLVKEANSLYEAGYQVTVVALRVNERLWNLDRPILERSPWAWRLVTRGTDFSYAISTALQVLARRLLRQCSIRNLRLACCAHHRLVTRLARAATKIPADLYIAHNLAAFPAAAQAAKKNRGKIGFDAEDFHTEELMRDQRDPGDQVARRTIEQSLLPNCSHLTASSPLIAEAYGKAYGVNAETILNVFPLCDAPESAVPPGTLIPASMYWFSQTIGPGRGLEEILRSMGFMTQRPMLYLRGNVSAGYRYALTQLARGLGIKDHLIFLEPAPPQEMTRLAQPYAIGLAIEPGSSPNNRMALSNKIFTYLLAGVPVVMSRTPAHEGLAAQLEEASILVELHKPRAVAIQLETFFSDPSFQERSRDRAWRLGHGRYNWDVEKNAFLRCVERASLTNAP